MDICKIVALALTCATLVLLLKSHKPEFAIQVSILSSTLILIYLLPSLKSVVSVFVEIFKTLDINRNYLSLIFKIIAISYVTEFGCTLCEDAGQKSLSSKIELSGKLMIMVTSAPIFLSFVNLIKNLIYWQ